MAATLTKWWNTRGLPDHMYYKHLYTWICLHAMFHRKNASVPCHSFKSNRTILTLMMLLRRYPNNDNHTVHKAIKQIILTNCHMCCWHTIHKVLKSTWPVMHEINQGMPYGVTISNSHTPMVTTWSCWNINSIITWFDVNWYANKCNDFVQIITI